MFHNEKMAAIGQLAAGIAHEVNNPLGGMRNCLKSLKETPDDREMRERYLELLDKGLMRIGHIVRQLLNFGRETPITPKETDIDALIRACFELLSFHLKDIDLQLDLAITTPYRLDGEVLKQALINIGLNAVQAMPDGGALTVTSREEPDGDPAGHRSRHPPDRHGAHFRTLLHHQGTGHRHRPGIIGLLLADQKDGRPYRGRKPPGRRLNFTIELPRQHP